ncbi:RAMP superfamily CRISPR-associated protein [Metallosphaera hakonensis]|nr:RAMP superfamily CRISPR-associated protein [Metallosphaera hakonensis]
MHFCIPCIIFGHKDLSGRMNIMDAEVEGNFELESYTGVSINRFFGGQQSGNLYNLDYVSPGANFRFKTIIFNVNLEKEDEEWRERVREGVLFLIRSLTQGIFVGGRKSTGAGLVKLTNLEVRAFTQGSWKEVKISW